MAEHEHFFQILQNKLGTSLRMHPWTAAQLNSSNIRLLSRKNLGEKLLDRILPLLAVSEELTRFVGLQPLKDWSRKRLRELENQQPLDSNLILRLKALREMCRNYGIEKLKPQDQFNSSREIFNHFHQQLEGQKQEQFIIVLLDNKHRYLAEEDVTKGILNKSLVHPREVFASAIEHRAAALICVHNHPSGDPEPSQEDFRITERLVEVGKLVGIPVLDHVIVGGDNYTSFADKGLL